MASKRGADLENRREEHQLNKMFLPIISSLSDIPVHKPLLWPLASSWPSHHLLSRYPRRVVDLPQDMNFRDYAQGAFRMRKVGKGGGERQTVGRPIKVEEVDTWGADAVMASVKVGEVKLSEKL